MSTMTIRPKTRAEWLELRKTGIGSSEVATILGLNPWETKYELWRRKRGEGQQREETFAMKAGHYLEDAVAQFWQDETQREVIKRSAGDWIIRSTERPYLQVSPDRTYWIDGQGKRNDGNKGILECKTTQLPVDADDLPKHWFAQLQYQLGVAELQQGHLAWLTQGREFGYKELAFVPDYFGWLVEETERFWTDNVLGGQEPELVNLKDVLLKYNRHTEGKVIEVDDTVLSLCSELKDVRRELAQLDERKAELEEEIKRSFGDAEAISHDGDTLATWRTSRDTQKFDSKRFQREHPDMAADYLTTVAGTRRFLLK